MSFLEIRSLCKSYVCGGQVSPVLRDISLSLDRGEVCAVTGASGSGKTTLMNLVGLLDTPDSGDILFRGRSIAGLDENDIAAFRNRSIGFVFQSFHLIYRLTLADNVALPLLYRGVPQKERRRTATAALERVGLGHRADSFPDMLSGGQRQRVAIARAIVGAPDLLLADEPTGNLDSHTATDILGLFNHLNETLSLTVLMITHDRDIASACRRTVALSDGVIIADDRKT